MNKCNDNVIKAAMSVELSFFKNSDVNQEENEEEQERRYHNEEDEDDDEESSEQEERDDDNMDEKEDIRKRKQRKWKRDLQSNQIYPFFFTSPFRLRENWQPLNSVVIVQRIYFPRNKRKLVQSSIRIVAAHIKFFKYLV